MSSKIREGFLLKFSAGLLKGWKKKYLILYQDGQLAFFDQRAGMKTGHVNIPQECRDLQVGAGIQSRLPKLPTGQTVDCLFSLITNSKKYLLLANNRQDLDSWLQVLHSVRGSTGNQTSSQNKSYPTATHKPDPPYAPPSYSHQQQPQPGPSLGFEALDLGGSATPYPPQAALNPYPPQQQSYGYPPQAPASNPGYPPQAAPGYSQPPPQGYPAPGYPPQQGYPTSQPAHAYPPQGGGYYPPQGGGYYPPPAPGYNHQYPGGSGYQTQYQYPQQAQYGKNHKSGGILGSLGGAAAGLGAMKMGRKSGGMMGMGGGGHGIGHKAMKHKGLLAGAGGALLGGYALKKMVGGHDSWSLGSGHSWGSGGSFGSFGSGCS